TPSLEVTFYGEEAQGYGGPRKEFLQLMLHNIIKEEKRLFTKKSMLSVSFFFQLMTSKLCTRYLLQQTAKLDLTLRKLRHILKPQFSGHGSNTRSKEEMIYEEFLKYLKEVTGNYSRRNSVCN
ncbi:uncharacterized protein LOC125379182, partial [Haliotis rufescens]|uniref:uncharacterized protein LOC125379182 n=1 Tax=Haliotis rufescens TaxID=6454 RepID=UPI00201F73B1